MLNTQDSSDRISMKGLFTQREMLDAMKLKIKKIVSTLLCLILTVTIMIPGFTAFSAGITLEITQDGAVVTDRLTVKEYSSIQLGYTLSADMPEGAYVVWDSNLPLLAGVDDNGEVTGYDYSKAAVFQLWLDEEVRTLPLVGETTANTILKALETAGIDLETADTATIVAAVRMVAGDSLADSLQNALDNMNVEITATLYDANGNVLTSDKIEVLVEMSYVAYALPTGIHITNKRKVPTTVAVGNQIQLYSAYTPVRTYITSDFKWESDNTSVATVDENGFVTFVGTGTVTIKLSFANVALFAYTDKVTFNVVSKDSLPVTDFGISGETSVAEGETTRLSISNLIPAGAYTGDLVWSTADSSIAMVDQNGVVTGLDGGSGLTYSKSTTISATINGVTRSVSVTVTRSLLGSSNISGVQISGETALGIGNSATYTSTVAPSRLSNNSDVVKSWGIIDPVSSGKIYATANAPATDGTASITTSGVLTGLKDGTTTIFVDATYNGVTVTDTYIVTVGVAITDFTISGTSEIDEGATTQLSVSGITPSNAVYDNIIWTSADPAIASVDSNGIVKGLDAGGNYSLWNNPSQSTTITATISGVSRSFKVTVKAKLGLNAYTGGHINGPDTLVVDIPYTYTATHTPARMNINRQYWGTPDNSGNDPWSTSGSISAPGNTTNAYVTVDSSTGTVKGLQSGSTQIWTYMANNVLSSSYQTLKKDVNIVELVPKSITITNPTKYNYLEGDTALDLTGLEVKVTYDKNDVAQYYPEAINWTDEQLTAVVNDYTVSEINTELLDNEQYIIVTVTRAGKSLRAIFPVLVSSKQVDSIKIAQAPQYQYTEGDTTLKLDGLKVVANYLNAYSEYITGYTVNTSDFDPTLLNVEQNITVTYSHAGRTASTTFPVIVYGIPVVSVTTSPSDYSGEWTSEDVTFTLDATNQVGGITYYYRTSPTEKWTKMVGNTLTVDTNIQQTYYFRAINGKNLISDETVGYVVNIDKVVPAITLTPSTTELTNQSYDVSISVDAIGASNIKKITLNNQDITGQGSFTVHENGPYVVKVESNSGLICTERIVVKNIDKDTPKITNIQIDAVNSGDYSALNDGFGLFFKGKVNATITSYDTGAAGVDYVEYRFIDENGNSLSDWTIYDAGNKPIVNSQFKGYIEARVFDQAGNASDIYVSKGFVVDCNNPTEVVLNATVENDVWTSNDVVIKLSSTSFSGIYKYYYSTDDGNTWIEMYSDTITVSTHGITNYQFKAKSYSGLESEVTLFTVKIDKTTPVIRVDFEGAFGIWTSDNVKFNFSTLNESISGITYFYSTDGVNWIEITTGNEILLNENTNATYIFKAINGAGVESNPSDSYKVMIDNVSPSIQFIPEKTEFTTEPYNIALNITTGDAGLKSVSVNGVDITGQNQLTVTENGTYVFVITGENGLTSTEILKVENIHSYEISITSIELTSQNGFSNSFNAPFGKYFNENVTIAIKAFCNDGEIGKIEYRLINENGEPVSDWTSYDETNKPVINTNFKGSVEARAYDATGTKTSEVSNSEGITIDIIVPTTPVILATVNEKEYLGEWTSDEVTINVFSNAFSDIYEYQYRIDNGEWNVMTTESIIAIDGVHTYEFKAISNANLESDIVSITTKVDKKTPELTVNVVGTIGTWTSSDIVFTLSSTNANSGTTYYYNNGNGWIEMDGNVLTVTENINATYTFKVINGAGVETLYPTTYKVMKDSVAPTVKVEHGEHSPNESLVVNVNSATGISGIKTITVDGKDITSTQSFTVTENGKYTVTVVSNNGLSATTTLTVSSFDYDTPNITDISIKHKNSGDFARFINAITFGLFFNEEVEITVTSEDLGVSGLKKIEYRLIDENGAPITEWTEYNSDNKPTVNAQFKGYVEARAIDNVGNTSPVVTSKGFVVDTDKPSINVTATVDGTEYDGSFTSENVILTPSSNAFSDIYEYQYRIDNGEWNVMTTESIIAIDGVHTYEFKAISNANLESDIVSITTKVDKKTPELTVNVVGTIGTWTSSDIVFTLSSTNANSGTTYYYNNGNGWIEMDGNVLTVTENINATYTFKVINDAGVESAISEEYVVYHCDHNCHKTGIQGFFWEITCFFNKLFKINQNCDCGIAHY